VPSSTSEYFKPLKGCRRPTDFPPHAHLVRIVPCNDISAVTCLVLKLVRSKLVIEEAPAIHSDAELWMPEDQVSTEKESKHTASSETHEEIRVKERVRHAETLATERRAKAIELGQKEVVAKDDQKNAKLEADKQVEKEKDVKEKEAGEEIVTKQLNKEKSSKTEAHTLVTHATDSTFKEVGGKERTEKSTLENRELQSKGEVIVSKRKEAALKVSKQKRSMKREDKVKTDAKKEIEAASKNIDTLIVAEKAAKVKDKEDLEKTKEPHIKEGPSKSSTKTAENGMKENANKLKEYKVKEGKSKQIEEETIKEVSNKGMEEYSKRKKANEDASAEKQAKMVPALDSEATEKQSIKEEEVKELQAKEASTTKKLDADKLKEKRGKQEAAAQMVGVSKEKMTKSSKVLKVKELDEASHIVQAVKPKNKQKRAHQDAKELSIKIVQAKADKEAVVAAQKKAVRDEGYIKVAEEKSDKEYGREMFHKERILKGKLVGGRAKSKDQEAQLRKKVAKGSIEAKTKIERLSDHEAAAKEKEAKIGPLKPMAIRASSTYKTSIDYTGAWNSGRHAPSWVELDFGYPKYIKKVVAVVSQSIAGSTVHVITLDGVVVGTWNGFTKDQDTRMLFVRRLGTTLRITTNRSPATVAWNSITAFSSDSTGSTVKTNTTSLCPEHSVPVDDAATCQAACDQLGLKFHEHKHLQNGSVLVYRKGASKHPKGCFMNSTVQHNNTFSACLINADQGGVSKHHKETEPRPVCIPGTGNTSAPEGVMRHFEAADVPEALVMDLDLRAVLSATLKDRSSAPAAGYVVFAGYRISNSGQSPGGVVQVRVQTKDTETAKQVIVGNLATNKGAYTYGGYVSFKISDNPRDVSIKWSSTGGSFNAKTGHNGYPSALITSSPNIIEGVTSASGSLSKSSAIFQTLTIPDVNIGAFDKWLVLANWRVEHVDKDGSTWLVSCELECLVNGKVGTCVVDDKPEGGTTRLLAEGIQPTRQSSLQLGGQSAWIVQPTSEGEITVNIKYKRMHHVNKEPYFLNDMDGRPKILAFPCKDNICGAAASAESGTKLDIPWGELASVKQSTTCSNSGSYLAIANFRLKMQAPLPVKDALKSIMAEGNEASPKNTTESPQVKGFAGAVLCKNNICMPNDRQMIAGNFKMSNRGFASMGGALVWKLECVKGQTISIAYNAPAGNEGWTWVDDANGHEPLLLVHIEDALRVQQQVATNTVVSPSSELTFMRQPVLSHSSRKLLGEIHDYGEGHEIDGSAQRIPVPKPSAKPVVKPGTNLDTNPTAISPDSKATKCHQGTCAHIHTSMGCPPEMEGRTISTNTSLAELLTRTTVAFADVTEQLVRDAILDFRFQVLGAVLSSGNMFMEGNDTWHWPGNTTTSVHPRPPLTLPPTAAPTAVPTSAPTGIPTFNRGDFQAATG